ncbi:hypothetical protein ABIF66_001317 [Bradyrhizobium japonicum]
MDNVIQLVPVTPSIDQLARIIGNVAAPAFLLGAVASFISVLISRINRVVDRAQFLHGITDDDTSKNYLKADIPRLRHRASLLNRSLFCSILSAILTALSSSLPSSVRCSMSPTNMAWPCCSWPRC